MKKILETICNINEDVILATIVKQSGSTPRGVGAVMLVGKEGLISGSIGGGKIEKEAIERAVGLLAAGESACEEYVLTMEAKNGLSMVCGGKVTVWFAFCNLKDESVKQVFIRALQALRRRTCAYLVQEWVKEVKESTAGIRFYLSLPQPIENVSGWLEENRFVIPCIPSHRALIFGGGHVAQALVPVLESVDFSCIVAENRPEFANPSRFPLANRVLCLDYENIADNLEITQDDFVILMTHGHEYDYTVLRQVLSGSFAYIGVMGSKRKAAAVREKLLKDGISQERIQCIHTPIGLAINSETPEEIAVSIAAECIMVRARLKNEAVQNSRG